MYRSGSRDTDEVLHDQRSQPRLDAFGGENVDATAKQIFEISEQPHVAVKSRRTVELNQNVEVTVRTCFVTGDGAKKRERAHAKTANNFVPAGGKRGDDFCALHDNEVYRKIWISLVFWVDQFSTATLVKSFVGSLFRTCVASLREKPQ